MTSAVQLRVRGTVSTVEKRTTPAGAPLLVVHLLDKASGQEVRATHAYPDASSASHHAASNLARQLCGQVAELDATNPRFRARRLDCDAHHILLPHLQQQSISRKDLE